jgi:predicted acetyltransferase
MQLVWPAPDHLASYVDALERHWSPDIMRVETAQEELARIRENPTLFLAQQVDREAKGPPVTLPDGSTVPLLPGYRRWMWDGSFCGVIKFRWQAGTTDLPPHCLGHIGFSVVPWKRRRGYATRALALLLPDVRKEGLPHVDLTTDADNVASQRVILANGGQLIEQFHKPDAYGGAASLRFRIPVASHLQPNER